MKKFLGYLDKILEYMNRFLKWLDAAPLWWIGFLLMSAVFAPFLYLRQGCVFPIHDQLDETILSYVFYAKHLFEKSPIFPEMLGGIHRSGMQPSAVLFVILYRLLPPLYAFLVQYAVIFVCGFFGMYGSVRKLTDSSILALASAGCFSLLPFQPVYGLSVMGVPLLLYAFLLLWEKRRICLAWLLILFFGLTTHLVLIGYVVLSFWALAIGICLIRKRHNRYVYCGFGLLTLVYAMVNRNLFIELIFGKSDYVSHREELVNYASDFWPAVKAVFLQGGQHAESLHSFLILPVMILLAAEGIYCFVMWRKGRLEKKICEGFWAAFLLMAVIVAIAFLYAFCKFQPVVDLKNNLTGFLRYFQVERFYWLYPTLWYLETALVFGVLWRLQAIQPWCKSLLLAAVLLPTINLIKVNSYFYRNVNQINNGSGVTGYISWESFYAEDLMAQLESAIGREMSQYRIAHLGISPAPSLMHGFYTADGYSNNYPLEYKHQFRRVIAEALEKNEEARVYFDSWGSRCYLFNEVTGTYWMLGKNNRVQYSNLKFDLQALRDLGCEYLFSGGEIADAAEAGLSFLGYYETETSYWGIWLYQLME